MFSKVIDHLDVDSEVNFPSTSQSNRADTSLGQLNQFDSTGINSAEIDKLSDVHDSSFDALVAIQTVTDFQKENLNTDEIIKKVLQICQEFLPYNSVGLVLKEANKWRHIIEEKKSEFEALLNGLQQDNTLSWILNKKTFILIKPKEYQITEEFSIYSGQIFIFPFSIAQAKGLCFFHITDEQLDISFNNLETIKVLLNQMALIINTKTIANELDQRDSLNDKLKTELIRASKLALAGELARGVTHEINNPLQIILGKLQLYSMNNGESDVLRAIENQSLKIASLVKEIFNITIEPENRSELIDLNFLIEKTVDLVKCQITKRGIDISIIKSDTIPGFIGNSTYLKRILLNLLLSAKKRLRQGCRIVIVTGRTKNGLAKIEIEDSGETIDASNSDIPLLENGHLNGEDIDYNHLSLGLMIKEMGGNLSFNGNGTRSNKVVIKLPVNNQKDLIYEQPEVS
jgi:signal transduction histidine kinase